MFQTKVVEEIKPHILCSVTFPRKSYRYEIMWKNNVERGRAQLTIWRMRIGCWITQATDTHSEYVILIAFPLQIGSMNAPQCYKYSTLQPVF